VLPRIPGSFRLSAFSTDGFQLGSREQTVLIAES